MLLTTIGALLFQILASIRDNDFLMVLISIALIILAILMVYDVIMVIRKKGLRCRIL